MTIEEEFFKAFGIEPKKTRQIVGDDLFFNVIEDEYYPEITDRKLLELENIILKSGLYLCLKSNRNDYFEYIIFERTKEKGFCVRDTRKEALLQLSINIQNGYTSHKQEINYKRDIKQQVKALFEGEE